jgi:hypothetical protein
MQWYAGSPHNVNSGQVSNGEEDNNNPRRSNEDDINIESVDV